MIENFRDSEEEKEYYKDMMSHSEELSREETNAILGGVKRAIQKKRITAIRLDDALLNDIKKLAINSGLSYQAYMRMILTKHVSDMKSQGKLEF